jgi:hypothetical protein
MTHIHPGVISRRCLALLILLFVAPILFAQSSLPRFTEEREAAARHFVKKHLPELLPLLEELKKGNRTQYESEIREIFQVTEMLADLLDEPKRHELELKIWKTENKAFVVVAKLSTGREEEKKSLESQLNELARELVDLELQSLEVHTAALEKDLQLSKEELSRLRENLDKTIKERYALLMDKVKRRKKN